MFCYGYNPFVLKTNHWVGIIRSRVLWIWTPNIKSFFCPYMFGSDDWFVEHLSIPWCNHSSKIYMFRYKKYVVDSAIHPMLRYTSGTLYYHFIEYKRIFYLRSFTSTMYLGNTTHPISYQSSVNTVKFGKISWIDILHGG